MYGSVNLVLDNHASLFSQFKEIVFAHHRLKEGRVLIDQILQMQDADTPRLTMNKIQLRGNVIRGVLKFSSALTAYATAINDGTLKTKANYSVLKLKMVADPILFKIGDSLVALAKQVKPELAKYTIGENEFAEIEKWLSAYNSAISQQKAVPFAPKVSANDIDDLFSAQDKLLNDEMDVLLLPFRLTQPDFYNAYLIARIVVDSSEQKKVNPDETSDESGS